MDECKEKCVSAGSALARDQESYKPTHTTPIIYQVNLRGLVMKDDLTVPHSELAIHSKAAGKEIIALFMARNIASLVYDDGEGCCGYIHGLKSELFYPELVKKVEEMFPEAFPESAGI